MERKTINELYFEWRAMKCKLVKESTLATYVTNAEKHILPSLGSYDSVSGSDVQSFAFDMLGKGLSVKTVRDVLLVLRMIVGHGVRTGYMEWRGWDIRLPRADVRRNFAVLTPGDQRKFMAHLRSHFSFRNLGLYICLCTGMRIGEICALKWGDISISSRIIRVSRTIERVYVTDGNRRFTKIIIGSPKTSNSCREIPISGELLKMLRPVMVFACCDYFVLTNCEKPVEPRMYRRYYYNLMSGLGMPDLKFHGLRHTFATRCIESNCDYKTVSSILGHSNISTTLNLYVHPDIGQKRKCIDRMLRTFR